MELDKAIQLRKSVRKYSKKTPDWRDIIEAIDSAKYAPMAGNNFTLKFIVIDEKEKIEKLADYSSQPFIAAAQYAIIVCSNPSRLVNSYEKGHEFNKQQVGAAIQNVLLKLEQAKLATCWVGYFEENLVRELLAIPKNIEIEAILPIGHESRIKYSKKVKANTDAFLYFNKYSNKKMKVPKRID